MKKRVLLIMGLSIMLLAGGCAKSDKTDKSKTDTADKSKTTVSNTVKEVTVLPKKKDYNPKDYVTLGKYKGIEVTYTKLEVTDADVDATIDQELNSHKTYKDTGKKVVENGDMVNIDYEGKIDGKAFDRGSATDAKLTIGSGGFIEGFEEGLKGKKVGEKTDLKLTFPKDYPNAEVAGKPAVFTVNIKGIVKEEIPTLNDKYVKDNTDYKTVAEYKKSIRDSLEAQNEQTIQSEKYGNAYGVIEKSSKIKKIPQALSDYYNNMMLFQYTNYAKQNGLDLKTFIKNSGSNEEQFNQTISQSVESYANQDIIMNAIAKAENIKVTDAELNDQLKSIMDQYGYKKESEVYKAVPKAEITASILYQKVIDFVLSNAKVTGVAPTSTPAPAAK